MLALACAELKLWDGGSEGLASITDDLLELLLTVVVLNDLWYFYILFPG